MGGGCVASRWFTRLVPLLCVYSAAFSAAPSRLHASPHQSERRVLGPSQCDMPVPLYRKLRYSASEKEVYSCVCIYLIMKDLTDDVKIDMINHSYQR